MSWETFFFFLTETSTSILLSTPQFQVHTGQLSIAIRWLWNTTGQASKPTTNM